MRLCMSRRALICHRRSRVYAMWLCNQKRAGPSRITGRGASRGAWGGRVKTGWGASIVRHSAETSRLKSAPGRWEKRPVGVPIAPQLQWVNGRGRVGAVTGEIGVRGFLIAKSPKLASHRAQGALDGIAESTRVDPGY